jgi:hypothetical protein
MDEVDNIGELWYGKFSDNVWYLVVFFVFFLLCDALFHLAFRKPWETIEERRPPFIACPFILIRSLAARSKARSEQQAAVGNNQSRDCQTQSRDERGAGERSQV